jgi:hypothetical protein
MSGRDRSRVGRRLDDDRVAWLAEGAQGGSQGALPCAADEDVVAAEVAAAVPLTAVVVLTCIVVTQRARAS